jgi:thiol-disulfide isomerase/thioredoxin
MSSCPAAKECGLHSGNIKKADGTTEERKAERDLWSDASAVAALDKAAVEKLAGGARDKDTLLVLYAPWCPFCQVGGGPWVFGCCVLGVGADMPILTRICFI